MLSQKFKIMYHFGTAQLIPESEMLFDGSISISVKARSNKEKEVLTHYKKVNNKLKNAQRYF